MNHLNQVRWNDLCSQVIDCMHSGFMREMQDARLRTDSRSSTSALDAAILYALVLQCKPATILESGSYRGMSTSFLRKAQVDAAVLDGCVLTVDNDPSRNLGALIPDSLRSGISQIVGNIKDVVDDSRIPPTIDMFFHDSTHRYDHQIWEYSTFWPRIRSGGLLASHDVNMSAAFSDFIARTYHHDGGGISDDQTSHLCWGRLSKIGFAQKR